MKEHIKKAGIAIVIIGALLLVASYTFGWNDINSVQFTGLGLIITGILLHIIILKRESRY